MACNKCKKQKRLEELENLIGPIDTGTAIFLILWCMLAIYGIISLVEKYS